MRAWFIGLSALALCACGDDGGNGDPLIEELGRCADFDELRQPFFGDTHIHTNLSLDANLQETRTSPDDAYAFAKGGEIPVQPYDINGDPLRPLLKLDTPLDWVMLSDHAEFLGVVEACQDPQYDTYNTDSCVGFRDDPAGSFIPLNAALGGDGILPSLCGSEGADCIEAGLDVWERVQDAAETAYDRTDACGFTSFIGYEYSSSYRVQSLHRNIMFRNHIVPVAPSGYFRAGDLGPLWSQLKDECIDAEGACDVLAIAHNPNASNGRYFTRAFKTDDAFDSASAQTRQQMEPLLEIMQHKGDSECIPGEAISDELCGFEKLPWADLATANLGGPKLTLFTEFKPQDYARAALGEGMKLQASLGANPFKLGFIASTDTHISAPGLVSEENFPGHGGNGQPNRTSEELNRLSDIPYNNPGGLAVAWAEENSREAIFEAMRRRETYGTSGPRMVVRFFGGWDYPTDVCDDVDRVQTGYQGGVPMGGDLAAFPGGDAKPSFFVAADQDQSPLSAVQIIKGYLDGADYKVSVVHVAGDETTSATVDVATCTPQANGSGSASLCGVWTDTDFDPAQRAFYYARVVENPTCRWTTFQCNQKGFDCENPTTTLDEQCCDPRLGLNVSACDMVTCMPEDRLDTDKPCCNQSIEPIQQERAWTSPIWFTP